MNLFYILILITILCGYLFLVSDVNRFSFENLVELKKAKEKFYFIDGLITRSIYFYKQNKIGIKLPYKYSFDYKRRNGDFKIVSEYKSFEGSDESEKNKEISINAKIYFENKIYSSFQVSILEHDDKLTLINYVID